MISPDHKAIFVHIPKCAGQSVEHAFLNDVGLTWETRAPLLLRKNNDPDKGPPRLAHLRGRDYVRYGYVDQAQFDAYYKFSIVRDPWARTVSLYRHLNPNMTFRDFVLKWVPDTFEKGPQAKDFWFVRPQSDFITDQGGIIVDDVLKFENLREDFARAAEKCGLLSSLPHKNANTTRTKPDVVRKRSAIKRLSMAMKSAMQAQKFEIHSEWSAYYDAETIHKVAQLYNEDADRFGYQMMDGKV